MKESGEQKYSFIPFLILAAFSIVAVLDAKKPLLSLRPPQPSREQYGEPKFEKTAYEINERIWNDPFHTNWFFEPVQQTEKDLQKQVSVSFKKNVLLMPVIFPDGPSHSEREARIRRRYALHLALSEAGYLSDAGGSLYAVEDYPGRNSGEDYPGLVRGEKTFKLTLETFSGDYLSSRWNENADNPKRIKGYLELSVAYPDIGGDFSEAFDQIIVAYIRKSDVEQDPIASTRAVYRKLLTRLGCDKDQSENLHVRVIGPVDSGMVNSILTEASERAAELLANSQDMDDSFAKLISKAEADLKAKREDGEQSGQNYFLGLVDLVEKSPDLKDEWNPEEINKKIDQLLAEPFFNSADVINSEYYIAPFATADWETLIRQTTARKPDPIAPGEEVTPDDPDVSKAQLAQRKLFIARRVLEKVMGIRYIRTIHNDSQVFQAILNELKVRSTISSMSDLDHIALIVESDTRYGRAARNNLYKGATELWNKEYEANQEKISETRDLIDQFEEKKDASTGRQIEDLNKEIGNLQAEIPNWDRIRYFPYVRGIDGYSEKQTEEAAEQDEVQSSLSAVPTAKKAKWQDLPPHGSHQIDYIRRLAEQIQQETKEGHRPIKAIGIVSTDMYDKLLLLRALKPQLPEVLFFTTDMETLYWHPSEIDFTRNLIVGSSYGLRLDKEVQGFVPPFRNNYQTSLFASVLMAANAIGPPFGVEAYEPMVYEIGTRGPIYISGGKFNPVSMNEAEANPGQDLLPIDAPSPPYIARIMGGWIIVLMASFAAILWTYYSLRGFCPERPGFKQVIAFPALTTVVVGGLYLVSHWRESLDSFLGNAHLSTLLLASILVFLCLPLVFFVSLKDLTYRKVILFAYGNSLAILFLFFSVAYLGYILEIIHVQLDITELDSMDEHVVSLGLFVKEFLLVALNSLPLLMVIILWLVFIRFMWRAVRKAASEDVSTLTALVIFSVFSLLTTLFILGIPAAQLEPLARPDGTSSWYCFFLLVFNTAMAVGFCIHIRVTRKAFILRAIEKESNLTLNYEKEGIHQRKIRKLMAVQSPEPLFIMLYFSVSISYAVYVQHFAPAGITSALLCLMPLAGVALAFGYLVGRGYFVTFCRKSDAGTTRHAYPIQSRSWDICRSFLFPLLMLMILTWMWAVMGASSFKPTRGVIMSTLLGYIQYFQFSSMLLLLSYVVFESFWVMVVVRRLSSRNMKKEGGFEFDPERILKEVPRKKTVFNHDCKHKDDEMEESLAARCVAFTSQLTEIPNRYMYFPFIVLFIFLLSKSTDFDNWAWTNFVSFTAFTLFALCLLPSVIIRFSAIRLRNRVIQVLLDRDRRDLIGKPIGVEGRTTEAYVSKLQSIRRGAYAPVLNQAFVLALLTPMGGIGSLALIKMVMSYLG